MTVLNAIYCPTLPNFTVLSEASNKGRWLSSAPPPSAPAAEVLADSSAYPARVMMQQVRPSGKADCSLQGQKGTNVLLCFSQNWLIIETQKWLFSPTNNDRIWSQWAGQGTVWSRCCWLGRMPTSCLRKLRSAGMSSHHSDLTSCFFFFFFFSAHPSFRTHINTLSLLNPLRSALSLASCLPLFAKPLSSTITLAELQGNYLTYMGYRGHATCL